MSELESGHDWGEWAMSPNLNPAEKALRNRFVDEYMVDFDPYKAAIRCGFLPNIAMNYSQQFMHEGYVLTLIEQRKREAESNPKQQEKADKELVLHTLRYAMQHGPMSSRVAAAREYATITGMKAPSKSVLDVNHRGGVMVVPGIANVDDWEQAALDSQQRLIEGTKEI